MWRGTLKSAGGPVPRNSERLSRIGQHVRGRETDRLVTDSLVRGQPYSYRRLTDDAELECSQCIVRGGVRGRHVRSAEDP